jgi:thioredoxin 1
MNAQDEGEEDCMMSTAVRITEQTFERDVLKAALPVLADFWAPWCAPCRMIAPIVDELSRDYEGRLTVAKINVDENLDLAKRYGVQSIPTLAVFKNGQMVSRIVGYTSKDELQRHIETALNARTSRVAAGRE